MITLQERNALVEQYHDLVWQIALRLYNRRPSIRQLGQPEDVVQIGFLGLMRAAEIFDPDHGVKFISYAYPAVHNTILRHADEAGLIRIPNWAVKSMRDQHAGKATIKGRAPTIDMARRAWKVERLKRGWDRAREPEEELDPPDPAQIRRLLGILDKRQRYCVVRYYGLDGKQRSTLKAIGNSLHLTRERVRQILARSLAKLRPVLEAEAA